MENSLFKLKNGAAILFVLLIFSLTILAQTNEEKLAEANKIYTEANALFKQNTNESFRLAREKFRAAARMFADAGEKKNQATSYAMIGLVSEKIDEKQDALENYNKALVLYRESGDVEREGLTNINIGLVYNSLNDYQKALEFFLQSLPLTRQISFKGYEMLSLRSIAASYSLLGEKSKALDYYAQSLSLIRQLGDKDGEALVLLNIGKLNFELGETAKALEFLNQSLLISRQTGDKAGEISTLLDMANILGDRSDWQTALMLYYQALSVSREIGDKKRESILLVNLGVIFDSLGDPEKALDFYNQALPLKKEIGDLSGQAAVFTNIGKVYADSAERDKNSLRKAIEYYEQALPLFRRAGNKSGEVTLLNNLGYAYYQLKENQKALEIYNQGLSLTKTINSKINEARLLSNIGGVYSDLNDKRKALEFFNQSLLLAQQLGDKSVEAQVLNNIMFAWNDLGNKKFAVFYGKQSINVFESIRSNIRGLDKNIQQNYLREISLFYRGLAEILIADGRLAEAQQILNLFKDQQFFDFNRDPNETIKRVVKTPRETELTARYESLTKRLTDNNLRLDEFAKKNRNRPLTAEETIQKQTFENEIKFVETEFAGVIKQYEKDFSAPNDAKDKVAGVPDTTEMQQTLQTLNKQTGQKTVAVYTLVGPKVFRALIITPDSIKTVSSPTNFDHLVTKSSRLFQVLQSDKYDPYQPAKEIYDIVFRPLEAELPKDTTTIMWSLDSVLRYLPPASFYDGEKFLVERYNHVIFTRPDSERLLRNVQPNWTALGLGSSEAHTVNLLGEKVSFNALPGTTEELDKILKHRESDRGIFKGELLEDRQFTKPAMLSALKQKRPLVHIASHFALRPGDESRSFLLMGDGSALTLGEMKRQSDLFAGVDLLTLSACNTATSASSGGREVDGFAELAQRLGAGAVIASLWSVADESTALLMSNFYRLKNEQPNITKADAMRQAQLAMLKGETKASGSKTNRSDLAGDTGGNKENFKVFERDAGKPFAHPYYWSPFVLIGNWK